MPGFTRRVALITALQLALLLAGAPLARAEAIRDIDWASLLPADALELQRQLQAVHLKVLALPAEQRQAMLQIARERQTRQLLDSGKTAPDQLQPFQRQLLEDKPSARYPEAARYGTELDAIQHKLTALQTTTNGTLNGQRVRLSGYLLPLEMDAGTVTEFLLVPFVGACIHVPPPPPNQIVQVALTSSYPADRLYAPVTVTGTLTTTQGQVELYLVDGSAMVDRGYRIDAQTVEAARSAE